MSMKLLERVESGVAPEGSHESVTVTVLSGYSPSYHCQQCHLPTGYAPSYHHRQPYLTTGIVVGDVALVQNNISHENSGCFFSHRDPTSSAGLYDACIPRQQQQHMAAAACTSSHATVTVFVTV